MALLTNYFLYRRLHYPPETATIMLILRVIAMIIQVWMVSTSNFVLVSIVVVLLVSVFLFVFQGFFIYSIFDWLEMFSLAVRPIRFS